MEDVPPPLLPTAPEMSAADAAEFDADLDSWHDHDVSGDRMERGPDDEDAPAPWHGRGTPWNAP